MNGEVRIPVAKGNIRRFDDPNTTGLFSYYVIVSVLDLPDLPLDVNPRAQNLLSPVSRKIRNGLLQTPESFHLLNRGITIIAEHAESDNRHGDLILRFPAPVDNYENTEDDRGQMKEDEYEMDSYVNNHGYGVVDGGHTFRIIRKEVERARDDNELTSKLRRAYVRLEVLVNVSDLAIDLARARNTSAQVKEQSLMNLDGKFKWLQEVVEGQPYAEKIMWRENEENKPIDARLIIQVLAALHPSHLQPTDRPPMIAYRGAGQCMTRFKDEEEQWDKYKQPSGYRQLRPIVLDILRLYDHIRLTMPQHYKEMGGLRRIRLEKDSETEVNGDANKQIRGRARAVASEFEVYDRRPRNLYFISQDTDVIPHQGLVIPVLSAFRAVVGISKKSSEAYWLTDPFELYNAFGQRYVRALFEQSEDMGRRPNAVGKSSPIWDQLYGFVQMDFIRSTGALEKALEASEQA
jgi:hypothetical protein